MHLQPHPLTQMKKIYQNKCYRCVSSLEYLTLDTAHVLAQEDKEVPRYEQNKLIDFSIGDYSNALLLCKNCHSMFDLPLPAWTFVPNDLDYFIEFEEEDWRRREENANNNQNMKPEPRTCPDACQYHTAYIAKDPKWPKDPKNSLSGPKPEIGNQNNASMTKIG